MTQQIYTVITFAPVQGFIEKSRKLRDLYGSSYLLSFLAQAICLKAEASNCTVISPALPDITQGLPNQVILGGYFAEKEARASLMETWRWILDGCREWIEQQVQGDWKYAWRRDWTVWTNHAWEFFCVHGQPGESISAVRQRLNEAKRSRAWVAINWQGESSTLSGTDAVAYPEMRLSNPYEGNPAFKRRIDSKTPVEQFYEALSLQLGKAFANYHHLSTSKIAEYGAAFIDPDEELSIPELVKRLITHRAIIEHLKQRSQQAPTHLDDLAKTIEQDLNAKTFRELNRLQHKKRKQNADSEVQAAYWTGWFLGDGDGASDYLRAIGKHSPENESALTQKFSKGMREWGKRFKQEKYGEDDVLPGNHGRVVYAGGDDFLGVLYRSDQQLEPRVCLSWLSQFKSKVWLAGWTEPHEKITASVGFVWASPQVPQRDVLQHCRAAEAAAKKGGKDRVAFRILFAGGNHLEWICPWHILEAGLFENYRDRNHVSNALDRASWTHFYNDVATLEARHAFGATLKESTEIAIALFQIYFPDFHHLLEESHWWNQRDEYKITEAGILGDREAYLTTDQIDIQKVNTAINTWVINLAKVGFHLCSTI
jgi:CRISPR-associated protein Cmr2